MKVFTPSKHTMRLMRRAFILLTCGPGAEHELTPKLEKLGGVVQVCQLWGIFDIMVEVGAESEKELKDIVFSRIRTLEHVKSTLTLNVVP